MGYELAMRRWMAVASVALALTSVPGCSLSYDFSRFHHEEDAGSGIDTGGTFTDFVVLDHGLPVATDVGARHLLGAAGGWGGNREKDALYVNVNPKTNDGATPHALTVKNVPVDGFWSISLYNAKGFFEQNPHNANSVNNITAKKNPDGSVTVHFGGDPKQPNYLAIMPGWNYMVRLYQPRKEILDGKYDHLPEQAFYMVGPIEEVIAKAEKMGVKV